MGRPITVRHLLTMTSGWGAVLEETPDLLGALIDLQLEGGVLGLQLLGHPVQGLGQFSVLVIGVHRRASTQVTGAQGAAGLNHGAQLAKDARAYSRVAVWGYPDESASPYLRGADEVAIVQSMLSLLS